MHRREAHLFSCDEVNPTLCAAAESEGIEIPSLNEQKRLSTINWMQSFGYALNLKNQLQINVPVVFVSKQYDFSTVDTGLSYEPPADYSTLFHPNERKLGFGDVQVAGQHYFFQPDWVVGLEVGARLPTASTKFNEYSLLEYHQPLGTGTMVPTARLIAFSRGDTQGALSNLSLELPLYENTEAYRTGSSMGFSVGYWRRYLEQKSVLMGQISVLHENRDQWHGQPIPFSYRTFLRSSLMGTYAFKPDLEGMMRLEMQLYKYIWEDEFSAMTGGNFPVLSVGLTWL